MSSPAFKPPVSRAIPWILFGVVLMPAVATTAVGIVVLVLGNVPGAITLGVLTITFAIFMVAGAFITLGLQHRQNKLARLQAEFIANVSHELRTPLSSIRMYVETLQMRRFHSDVERDELLAALDSEASRLTQLVQRILTFRHADSGAAAREQRTTAPAATLLDDALAPFRVRPDVAQRLRVHQAEDLPPLHVSEEGFRDALSNLVQNALTHGGDGPVTVTSRAEAEGVALSVRDEGPGISKRDQKRIFKRFERGHSTTESQVAGFGLGLSIVQRFARDHGGRVSLESEPGRGAELTLWLPAAPGTATGFPGPSQAERGGAETTGGGGDKE